MNLENFQPKKQTGETQRFTVGAKKNPDGTMDYSKAVSINPESEFGKQVADSFSKAKEEEKQARAKKIEIPAYVKPGTSTMVWHTLKNTVFLNTESLKNSKETNSTKDKIIKKLEKEISIIENLRGVVNDTVKENTTPKEKKLTDNELREKILNFSANDMYDLVEKHYTDNYLKLQAEGKELGGLYVGHTEYFPIEELLEASRDLQNRLMDEASRTL